MHNGLTLRVSVAEYRDLIELLGSSNTIRAIKLLRNVTNCGLKEAKHAVDRLKHEKLSGKYPHMNVHPEAKKVVTGPEVLGVKLDYGDGPVELDLENMQLRALTDLGSVGVEACAHMLSLIDIFKAINDGYEVHIDKESMPG